MKVKVLKSDFAKSIAVASRFASTRTQLPIVTNIKLSVQKTRLHILATNLEMSIATSIGAEVAQEGDIAVPSKVLSELTAVISADQLSLESKQEHLHLTGGGFSTKVLGVNTADFPAIPESLASVLATIPVDQFHSALQKVLFSAAKDEARPILTGVLFLFNDDGLSLVSSDGFRLSLETLPISWEGDDTQFVVPKGFLVELMRFEHNKKDLSFAYNAQDNQLLVSSHDTVFSSRVIRGDYPPFRKIIPASSQIQVNVDKDDLQRAIKGAAVFSKDAAHTIHLIATEGALKITAESTEVGSHESAIPAKIAGGDFDISFNYRFIDEYLGSMTGKDVAIELTDSSTAGVFKDPSSTTYLHLIMPIKPR